MSFNTKAILVLLIVIITVAIALVLVPPPKTAGISEKSFQGPSGEPYVEGPSVPPPAY